SAFEHNRQDALVRQRGLLKGGDHSGKRYGTTYYRKKTKYPVGVLSGLGASADPAPVIECHGSCTGDAATTGAISGNARLTGLGSSSAGAGVAAGPLQPEQDVTYRKNYYDGHRDRDIKGKADRTGLERARTFRHKNLFFWA
ncbi:hypothetical protein HK405_014933, partial [Cladochytrium tenue]